MAGSTVATRRGRARSSGPTVDMSKQWLTPAVLAEYSGDGRRIVSAADDRRLIKLWDAEDGRRSPHSMTCP